MIATYSPLLLSSKVLGELPPTVFERFCHEQRELRIERNEAGEIEIMSPTHSYTGRLNLEISRQLANWAIRAQVGVAFDSSSGFYLDAAQKVMRSPDASFVLKDRYDALPIHEKKSGFLPLCPDFVVELKSHTDSLPALKEKMLRYLGYGAQTGWLIAPETETVYVYQADETVVVIEGFDKTLEGPAFMPGFQLDLKLLPQL